MVDVIFISGPPGSGKTTVSRILRRKLKSPCLELDWIRSGHLDEFWSNATYAEMEMSYEILGYTLEKYVQHGYKNIIVNGVDIERVLKIGNIFESLTYVMFTFVLGNEDELKRRILNPTRDSGNRDFNGSVRLNNEMKQRPGLKCEHKLDSSSDTPEETVGRILAILHDEKA